PAGGDAAGAAQLIVHRLGRAGFPPAVQRVVDAAPVREVGGHRPPPDALPDQVADRVDGVAAAALRRAAAPALLPGGPWQRGLGDRPFGVAHVRRIARCPGAAADAARAAAAPHRPASCPGVVTTAPGLAGPGPRTLGAR